MSSLIEFWITLPLGFRFFLVALFGLFGAALANVVIYRCAFFNPRSIPPWGPAPKDGPPRRWFDRIPIFGWITLRRESAIHGKGFWIRPLLIEAGTSLGLMWLYQFETQDGGLLPAALQIPAFLTPYESIATAIFFAHAVLVVLMVAATFIDFDERIIPDIITIPGTLFALMIAALAIPIFLPTALPVGRFATEAPSTTFDSPWFVAGPWGGIKGLVTALAIWSTWCFALADRRWSAVIFRRRGFGRAIKHFCNGLFHYGSWKLLAGIWLVGIVGVWRVWNLGGANWQGLFTALIGLAVGGGVIWAIRIVATWALGMEAMGFGDVTLMAMIGAFIGWQASLIAFFFSPFAAIVIVVVRFVITRDTYTPFGPYLCAGTMLTIVFWDALFNGHLAGNLLMMGAMLLWLCIAMLGLMGVMLMVWRRIKMAILS
ncbi:MAG: prepilin peptidase [Planctomycetota bacterium]